MHLHGSCPFDPHQNELAILEFIHTLVETLDKYFENVVSGTGLHLTALVGTRIAFDIRSISLAQYPASAHLSAIALTDGLLLHGRIVV